jgi:hypothetical protein
MKKLFAFLTALQIICAAHAQELQLEQARRLIQLPLKCLNQEYPNKIAIVFNQSEQVKEPHELHPTFYGCFDWHSSVHGHWLIVHLIKQFPQLDSNSHISKRLLEQFTPEKIQQELSIFSTKHNGSFERTYGWAWILQLQMELDAWDSPTGKQCANALRPLTEHIVKSYKDYLPKLVYPIRSGEHTNTAFGLTFAHDYAMHTKDTTFLKLIKQRSIDFYFKDAKSPIQFEPSGYDFLSGTLEEIDLMQRVLDRSTFQKWLKQFLPEITSKKFQLIPGKVLDRTDGKLVHLDGLNFSRAWCLYRLAAHLNSKHLYELANAHLNYSLPNIVDGDYMGEHWLASFATFALSQKKQVDATFH